jgi:hypothetical protein
MRAFLIASAVLMTAAISGPTFAQQAATPAAKPAAKGKPLVAKVSNKRNVAVRSLQFIPAEAEVGPSNALKTPLAKGKTITVPVNGPKGECNYIIVGEYEDGLEIAGGEVNLCKDNTIVLVD